MRAMKKLVKRPKQAVNSMYSGFSTASLSMTLYVAEKIKNNDKHHTIIIVPIAPITSDL